MKRLGNKLQGHPCFNPNTDSLGLLVLNAKSRRPLGHMVVNLEVASILSRSGVIRIQKLDSTLIAHLKT